MDGVNTSSVAERVTIAECYPDHRSILSIVSAEFRSNLAYSSRRVRWWAWPKTLVVYTIGVLGRLWQVSMGIPQGCWRQQSMVPCSYTPPDPLFDALIMGG